MTLPDTRKNPGKYPLIEFNNITVMKGDKKILDSLSLFLNEGENIAILGPNGAGKSSFIKTITREYYPVLTDNGMVFRIRGKDTWDVFDLRSTIGIVSNDLAFAFSRDMTAREVILSGFFSSIGLFRHEVTREMEHKTSGVLDFLEIPYLDRRKMTEMSSGEARRVLIGRALVHDPKTLILDEPTNSLDLHALHTFRATCRKIARAGTGIILVSHNLQDIIPEISRVVLMKKGKFVMDGPKDNVLTDKNISDLFTIPVRVRNCDGYYYATGY